MTEPEPFRIVRPTLRCLVEDLGNDVGPSDLRAAMRTARADLLNDPHYLFPCSLSGAEHPVLDKANQLAADDGAQRERIAAITDLHAVKVKTGDRRGATWRDEAGTWWLLAAGRRKNDTSGDFYKTLERLTGDSSSIAPTDDDYSYQQLEAAYEHDCAIEHAAQAEILGAVLAAARTPGVVAQARVFGAELFITITPDEGDLAVLEMSWEFAEFDQQHRFPMDVLAMVPGCESIEAWEYLPPPRAGDLLPAWYAYVTDEWVQQMSTSAELDELLANGHDWNPVNPSSNGSEHFSHYAKGSIVTLAYVTGIEINALCGASVVAHRDYESFPVCPTCQGNLNLLRSLRAED